MKFEELKELLKYIKIGTMRGYSIVRPDGVTQYYIVVGENIEISTIAGNGGQWLLEVDGEPLEIAE